MSSWLTDNCLRAAEALSELALELEAKTARDIGAVASFDNKSLGRACRFVKPAARRLIVCPNVQGC